MKEDPTFPVVKHFWQKVDGPLETGQKFRRHGKFNFDGFFEIFSDFQTLFINQNIYLSKITEPTNGMRIWAVVTTGK
jgi:hypothetical protein